MYNKSFHFLSKTEPKKRMVIGYSTLGLIGPRVKAHPSDSLFLCRSSFQSFFLLVVLPALANVLPVLVLALLLISGAPAARFPPAIARLLAIPRRLLVSPFLSPVFSTAGFGPAPDRALPVV